jgi:hypothetical protein
MKGTSSTFGLREISTMLTAENRFATGSAVTVTDGSNGEVAPDSLPPTKSPHPGSKGDGRGPGGRFGKGNKFGRGRFPGSRTKNIGGV